MGLFSRKPKSESFDLNAPIDADVVRRVADLVNAGDVDGADKLCQRTQHPRETAFAAFRFINPE